MGSPRLLRIIGPLAALTLVAVLLAGCGDDDTAADSTTSSAEATSTSGEATTSSGSTPTTASTSTSETTTGSDSTTSTSGVPTLEQPAIWPAPGVVFDSPEAAASDFVSKVLGVPPNLGDFQQGDSRSGEIELYSTPEGGGSAVLRSVLLLRQLGPDDGWYVLAAVNGDNTIASPASGAAVAAGPVEVSGQGRGFEGLVVVEAFVAGDPASLDQELAQGGSAEATEPYSVTLDLSGAESGDTVLILVRGGVGLETDPGELSAIPVLVD